MRGGSTTAAVVLLVVRGRRPEQVIGRMVPCPDHEGVILRSTRAVAYTIVPFLIVGFAVLYPVPTDTRLLFAWPVQPTISAMVLGSAYLGGAYFFVRVTMAREWHTVKGGFLPVALFASLMGVSTALHWAKFNHDHVAFWLWTLLYFTTPFLIVGVWLRNRRHDPATAPSDVLLPRSAAVVIAAVGGLAVGMGGLLYLAPAWVAGWWPWHLTPLTGRVLAAVLCLGSAGLGATLDRRWSAARLSVQVAVIMLTLMLAAGVRAHAEFDPGNPLTWLLAAGFTGALGSLILLYRTMRRR